MKRKIISILLCGVMSLCFLTSCGKEYEIGLVTTSGVVLDKAFNQGAWEAVQDYTIEYGTTCQYYNPKEMTVEGYIDVIKKAISGGAKVVVCPGHLFEEPVYILQEKYPEVYFILIDGEPHNDDYSEYATNERTMSVLFKEEEAGYLAGYLAVVEGYRNLGFLGGMALPSVVDYGYGFVQGIKDASEELQVGVTIRYDYTGEFQETAEAEALASTWYKEGTEVIFACGGPLGNSVMSAAEANNGKVIGVDIDQSEESDTVIFSAMKNINGAVYKGLVDYNQGIFSGGASQMFMASNNGVEITMDTARVNNITESDYEDVYNRLSLGEIVILDYTSVTSYVELISDQENIRVIG